MFMDELRKAAGLKVAKTSYAERKAKLIKLFRGYDRKYELDTLYCNPSTVDGIILKEKASPCGKHNMHIILVKVKPLDAEPFEEILGYFDTKEDAEVELKSLQNYIIEKYGV